MEEAQVELLVEEALPYLLEGLNLVKKFSFSNKKIFFLSWFVVKRFVVLMDFQMSGMTCRNSIVATYSGERSPL